MLLLSRRRGERLVIDEGTLWIRVDAIMAAAVVLTVERPGVGSQTRRLERHQELDLGELVMRYFGRHRNNARFGLEADPAVRILREELYERDRQQAAATHCQ